MSDQQRDISTALESLRPQRSMLSDNVYEPIKRLIMDNVVTPGNRIGIELLARELHVSPTPIREALARLEAEGLVSKEPLKGYRATPLLGRDETNDLFEMRLRLEPWAAGQAASRASNEERRALETELTDGLQVPDGERYADYRLLTDHDQRFHQMIVNATGNSFVASAFRSMNVHLHLFRLHYGSTLGATVPGEHSRVVEAIIDGDPDAATAAMDAHLHGSWERLLHVFERSSDEQKDIS